MRGRKALLNSIFSLAEEFAAIIVAFILPRLILSTFGSVYNGLITSITQFLQCAVLLRCGIGGATRSALYKPLAEKNQVEINSIIKATDIFMRKVGLLLGGLILLFACIYPAFVSNDFGWLFTFTLFIIIGASTFAESLFGITYMILLQADQMLWVSSILRIICYVLNLVVSVFLLKTGVSIHIVKLGSALIYIIYPIVLRIIIRKKYNIDSNVKPNNNAIAQRWDAFWHQFSLFIMDNTDIIVLTIFSNMLEVSVYSVYNLVVMGVRRAVMAFSSGLEAAFGNMLAKNENEAVKHNLSVVETLMYILSTIVFTSSLILVTDFVKIYTAGIEDVDYIRPTSAYIIIIAQFFYCVRLPYQMVVQAAGKYKDTKYIAIIEPILNIVVSVTMVIKFGLVGVAIGTLVASLFKTVMFSNFMSQKIINRKIIVSWVKCLAFLGEGVMSIVIIRLLPFTTSQNYGQWIINAIFTVIICSSVVVIGSLLLFNRDSKLIFKKIVRVIRK